MKMSMIIIIGWMIGILSCIVIASNYIPPSFTNITMGLRTSPYLNPYYNITLVLNEEVNITPPGPPALVMNTSRILPINPNPTTILLGYCNATDTDCPNVTYNWQWYKDNISIPVICYQEFANGSTLCGGFDNGTYIFIDYGASWNSPWNGTDGDWNTAWKGSGEKNHLFINYTKPIGATSAKWAVKDSGGSEIINISTDCFNAFPNKIAFFIETWMGTTYGCWNGTTFPSIRVRETEIYVYEEAVTWQINNWHTSESVTQGIETNVGYLTGLILGSEYKLECRANDNVSTTNWLNSTPVIVGVAPNTCTYTLPGSFKVNLSDGCNLTDNTVINGGFETYGGPGYVFINANITNTSYVTLASDDCTLTTCEVKCGSGGCVGK